LHPTYGLSHNISREGLFVRTLDAPKPGTEVWLELRAPESNDMVHLRGEVVWRREPGAVGATPFGFGMKLDPSRCAPADIASFVRGYEQMGSTPAEG
ncbi:MAG TPA: PilZ domain-containing protein, partial [Polyangiales bacterium]|nr:PilZ domain-containing protein [Polyangiales bacterium]